MSHYASPYRAPLSRLALACSLLFGAGTALAGSNTPLNLNLPAQPLEAAVHTLAREAGVAIAADSQLLAGRSAQPLNGQYTLHEALQHLLANTGLVASEENGVIVLRQAQIDGALNLGETRVNGAGLGASDLPEAYSGGQVATGARLGLLGDTQIMDTPFNITSYTAQTIENQQSGTVGAVLRNDPSIRFSTGEGHAYENFMIRGFSLDSAELALNGLYGMAPDGHVPTEFLDRVEVLKGPGALLSGMAPSGGVGGVINLVPKRAGENR